MCVRSRRGHRFRARRTGRVLSFCAASAVVLAAQGAHAFPEPAFVEFQADEATIDPATQTLSLDGHVTATCGRASLEADRLRLRASEGGASIWGPAELSLCPCAQAPVRIAFERARVEARGDVIVSKPRLRIGDTTVLALPALWLRSADQAGVLPPRLAWRGDGGLLLGSGVHVPWKESDEAPAWMDLYVSGYSRGGFEVEPSVFTQSSSSRIRFDRTEGDLVRVVSTGTSQAAGGGGMAWSADLSRGSRARSGLIAIDEAAQRFDAIAARVDLRSFPGALIGVGFEGLGSRGDGSLGWGPVLSADGGGELGNVGVWSIGGSSRVFSEPQHEAEQLSSAHVALAVNDWIGPISLGLEGAATAAGWVRRETTRSDLAAWTNLRLGIPLSRTFSSGLVHRVEPALSATLLRARSDGNAASAVGRPSALSEGTRWVGSAGAATVLGRAGAARGVSIDVEGGGIGGPGAAPPSALLRGEMVASVRWFSLRWRGAAVLDRDETGAVVFGRAQLGGARTAMLVGDIATRTRVDPAAARALNPSESIWLGADGLEREGTSMMLAAGIPLVGSVRAEAVGHWDIGAERALSTGGGLAYEHPCGCLSARSWLGRRVGREGVDAWLTLDLTPR